MHIELLNHISLSSHFASFTLEKGQLIAQALNDGDLNVQHHGFLLAADIKISAGITHRLHIFFWVNDQGKYDFEGLCDCPMETNCEHIAALFCYLTKPQKKQRNHHIENQHWFGAFEGSMIDEKPQILYILNMQNLNGRLSLCLNIFKGKFVRKNTYSLLMPIHYFSELADCTIDENDRFILHHFFNYFTHTANEGIDNDCLLSSEQFLILLPYLFDSNHLFWGSPDSDPLQTGKEKKIQFYLPKKADREFIQYRIEGTNAMLLPIYPLYYVDIAQNSIGPLQTDLNEKIAEKLIEVIVNQQDLHHTTSRQSSTADNKNLITQLSVKTTFSEPKAKIKLFATPMLNHDTEKELLTPKISLYFIYLNHEINASYKVNSLVHIENNELIEIVRDHLKEKFYVDLLNKQLKPHYYNSHQAELSLLSVENTYDDAINFLLKAVPLLESQGFLTDIDNQFPLECLPEKEEWYARIEESDHHEKNSRFELGVQVKDEYINLIPAIINWMQSISDPLTYLQDKDQVYIPINQQRYVAISSNRLRKVIQLFNDIYAIDTFKNNKLEIPTLHALDLLNVETALDLPHLQWFGNENLSLLKQSLTQIGTPEIIDIPASLQATLRPYQHVGLNWLQFLRQHALGGILADDMGLGKTVQTLSHLLVEKEQNRMQLPSLIITPTSLVSNWVAEASRFAPAIKVLPLHGQQRKQHHERMHEYDLVITTYPLMIRDYAILSKQPFYFLILDEAQLIKNARAKATQVIFQLQSQYRLCLTGTPLENHLGELWSLFHFLMPGLLGNLQQFNRMYRIPIEKHGNQSRKTNLQTRISPFLLRRTKVAVVPELPPKTEIIRRVELEDEQLDLYETVRVLMQEKIFANLKEGLTPKNRILVLDALLKLRQICCDPRLVKLTAAQHVKRSVKMELLLDMLTNLLEEGRSILLFSNFAQMLELIEAEIKQLKIPYAKLTGKTKDRAQMVERFQSGEARLFLISLKAGGVGLNLTAADTIIHYDPWWNPAAEEQATDRAYRIGQDKPIFVYKLLTVNTVEEKILAMQEQKRQLIDGLFRENIALNTHDFADTLLKLFEPLEENN